LPEDVVTHGQFFGNGVFNLNEFVQLTGRNFGFGGFSTLNKTTGES
jgi:hypothetical protein